MRNWTLLGAIAGLAILAPAAQAQDQDQEPNPVFQVTTIEVVPASLPAWYPAWVKQAQTAKAMGISSGEYGWWMYGSDNTVLIVRPKSRDELFRSGTGIRAAIRAVDSAQAAAIGEAFAGIQARASRTEITAYNPDLSYLPDDASYEPGGVSVWELTLAPGKFADFRARWAEMRGLLKELKYPYGMNHYTVRYGDNRVQLVAFFDTRENYYGKNSLNKLFEANPEVAKRAGPIYRGFLETVASMKTTVYDYNKEASFPPGS